MSQTTLAIPTVEEEIWRYSRIGELQLDRFAAGTTSVTIENADGVQVQGSDATSLVGSGMRSHPDIFAQLNTEHGVVIALHIGKGKVHPSTVVITHTLSQSGIVAYPRLVIKAEENSEK